jgi:hypothetical protein
MKDFSALAGIQTGISGIEVGSFTGGTYFLGKRLAIPSQGMSFQVAVRVDATLILM